MNKDNKNPKKVSARMWLVLILSFVLMFTLIYVSSLMTQTPIKEVSFNEFMTMVEEEKVVGVEIGLGYADKFTFTDADGNVYKTDNPKSLNFKRELLDYGIEVKEVTQSSWASIIVSVLQYAMLIGVFLWKIGRAHV